MECLATQTPMFDSSNFQFSGDLIESGTPDIPQMISMYQSTLELVQHMLSGNLLKTAQAPSKECRLGILSLKVQAYVSYRVHLALNRDQAST